LLDDLLGIALTKLVGCVVKWAIFSATALYKLQRTSLTGGELAQTVNNGHQLHVKVASINLNAVLFTEGFANQLPIRFLLDSGAAVSVINFESLPIQNHSAITETKSAAISANGMPLEVIGQIMLLISMKEFTCTQVFVIIKNLAVDYPLGADFLKKHGAIIDCQSGTLRLGSCIIPMCTGNSITGQTEGIDFLQSNLEIAGHSIQVITGKVNGNLYDSQGFIEPFDASAGLPKHVHIACSLCTIMPNNEVFLQVMNISPSPVKMYKGMKLGRITP